MRTTRATRQLLAVVVVTTALCANEVVTAAPAPRPQVAARDAMPPVVQLAGRLVSRLSQSFCRVVPRSLPAGARQPGVAAPDAPARWADQSLAVVPPPLSPFQFRLPPPLV